MVLALASGWGFGAGVVFASWAWGFWLVTFWRGEFRGGGSLAVWELVRGDWRGEFSFDC